MAIIESTGLVQISPATTTHRGAGCATVVAAARHGRTNKATTSRFTETIRLLAWTWHNVLTQDDRDLFRFSPFSGPYDRYGNYAQPPNAFDGFANTNWPLAYTTRKTGWPVTNEGFYPYLQPLQLTSATAHNQMINWTVTYRMEDPALDSRYALTLWALDPLRLYRPPVQPCHPDKQQREIRWTRLKMLWRDFQYGDHTVTLSHTPFRPFKPGDTVAAAWRGELGLPGASMRTQYVTATD
jgi:hypothetical protein